MTAFVAIGYLTSVEATDCRSRSRSGPYALFFFKWLPSLLNCVYTGRCQASRPVFVFFLSLLFFLQRFSSSSSSKDMANNVGAVLVTVLDTYYCLASSIFLITNVLDGNQFKYLIISRCPYMLMEPMHDMKLLYERFTKTTCLCPCLSPLRIPNINSTPRACPAFLN